MNDPRRNSDREKRNEERNELSSVSFKHLSNVFLYCGTPAIYDLNVFRGLLGGSSLGNFFIIVRWKAICSRETCLLDKDSYANIQFIFLHRKPLSPEVISAA